MKAFFKKTAIIAAAAATLCLPVSAETVLRVGHFPNISHAQALVAHRLSMLGKGWFEERLGAKKVLLTTSCSHALDMMALLADIGIDDEVIIPSYNLWIVNDKKSRSFLNP